MHIVKIGGNELDQPGFLEAFAKAISLSESPTIIVHGGGRSIAEMQAKLGLTTSKVDGLRVTDASSLAVAQMVLSGQANKQIVAALLAAGIDAIGISGVDGGLLHCHKKAHPTADLGFVGEIVSVRRQLLEALVAQGFTVVVSPISLGTDGYIYNVNADEAASAVAQALDTELLDFVSNVPGVLNDGQLISKLTPQESEMLIAAGIIRDGMIPKVRAALDAVAKGIPQARIVDLAGLNRAGGTFFHQQF